MRIYLTTRSIPELASLPDLKRAEVWQRCHPRAWRHWQTWLAFMISMCALAASYYIAARAMDSEPFSWVLMAIAVSLLLIGSGGFFPVHVAMTRRHIREELSK
jgi:hypothetical protein